MMIFLSIVSLLSTIECVEDNTLLVFPVDFKFGVATSAYQIEGAWNVGDKGVSVWDDFTHKNPSRIVDGSNGDVACDSYHNYQKDVALLKKLGVNFYRFSVSWTRILPTGYANNVSKLGIKYYNDLIDNLNALGIESWITIYHWDHPVVFEEMGGWTNPMMITWFADYARIIFREFGDRVKVFVTLNEPTMMCYVGYGVGKLAPGKKYQNHAPYLCVHNMLKAHAEVYKIYDSEFRNTQRGQIGIALLCEYVYPKNNNDNETAGIGFAFSCGWAADPIYSAKGDYPAVMKQRIAENSELEGYPRSRLPEFTEAEINDIRGSADFLGLNHYSSSLTEAAPKTKSTPWYNDSGVTGSQNASWPRAGSLWLAVVPEGFGNILRLLKQRYNNPIIYVLENGFSDIGNSLNNYNTIHSFHDYLRELLIAVNRDGCNVKGYSPWSLLDNFQWKMGYTEHFGLVRVDFKDPARKRIPKLSYSWYQELIRSRKLPPIVQPKLTPIHSLASVVKPTLNITLLIYVLYALLIC